MDFIDEVVQKAQETGKYIADKADQVVDYVTLEYKASSLRGNIDRCYKELGVLYYRISQSKCQDGGQLQEKIDQIESLLCELNALQEDMAKYKNICAQCGTKNQAKAEYCSKCGAKLK